jgi:hypothetical protein
MENKKIKIQKILLDSGRQLVLLISVVAAFIYAASGISGAKASTEPSIEVVAVIEVVSGFTNTYNVGMSFANNNDCLASAQQLNMMLSNLVAQGVSLGGKPIQIACEESIAIKMPVSN